MAIATARAAISRIGMCNVVSAGTRHGADLAFGDIIAFEAIDSRHGRHYRPGTLSVGIVAHGPSPAPGHGVGVTILLSGPSDRLRLVLDERASLASMLRALAEAAGEAGQVRASAPARASAGESPRAHESPATATPPVAPRSDRARE
jgi:hypothetical protein